MVHESRNILLLMYTQIVYWWWRFIVILLGLLFPPSLLVFATPYLDATIKATKHPEIAGIPQIATVIVLIICIGEIIGLIFFIREAFINRP